MSMRRRAWASAVLIGAALIAVVASIPSRILGEVLERLALGWASYLGRVAPQVSVSRDAALAWVVAVLVFGAGLHAFLRWLHDQATTTDEPSSPARRRWRLRWTAAVVTLLILMFVVGVAAAGVAHQMGWLLRSKQSLVVRKTDVRPSGDNLKMIGLGIHNYVSVYERFPGPSLDEFWQAPHSWQTAVLPYLPYQTFIDPTLPWDHPKNLLHFKLLIPEYLNPEIGVVRDERGLGLSHYAANARALNREPPLTPSGIGQGASNLILVGEVAGNFLPWGDPANSRDPELGLNRVPDGFGNPQATGAQFLMADGSVRFLSNRVDPTILRALSRPRDGRAGRN